MDKKTPVENLRNLGIKSGKWLRAIGVKNLGDIAKQGSFSIYQKLHQQGYPVSRVLCWALIGAMADCHWQKIPAVLKDDVDAKIDAYRARLATKRRG